MPASTSEANAPGRRPQRRGWPARLRPAARVRELARFAALHALPWRVLDERHAALPHHAAGRRVVVSLTTIPDRIDRLRPTLLSLLDQSVRPDVIRLNLPERSIREDRAYAVPPELRSLRSLECVPCPRDWGPATKLIPTLEQESDPDTLIVVVDDDQVYPRILLETLLSHHARLPHAALASRGFSVPRDLDPSLRDTLYGTHLRRPARIEIIQGSAGYLVQRRFFDESVFDYQSAPEGAFYCDDVWFSGHLARAGVERFVVPFACCFSRLQTWSSRRTLALFHRENRDGSHDRALYRAFLPHWRQLD